MEKQKIRFNYCINEKQLVRLVWEAKACKEPTGDKLLEFLERRLDNAVFRAGFAPTILSARQLISHRHVLLNGRAVNIPSIRVRVGDVICMRESGCNIPFVMETRKAPSLSIPEWLKPSEKEASACVARLPEANEAPVIVDMQQVVEYYAVRV